jgi:hypothetical protein
MKHPLAVQYWSWRLFMVVSWDDRVRGKIMREREPLNEDGESAICGSLPKMTRFRYNDMLNILNFCVTCFLEKRVDGKTQQCIAKKQLGTPKMNSLEASSSWSGFASTGIY